MYYDYAIVVPANTLAAAPVVERLKLTKGVIHRIEVGFPAGCQGMVYLALGNEGAQLWPLTRGCAFNAEDYNIPIDERYELAAAPFELEARAWSPGTSYQHTITVRVGVLSKETFEPSAKTLGGLDKLLQLIGVR